ncbi:hypothetical protein QT381_05205 [Galbitalea sp. SE-J8]|uniref:hypothetical protein n=1 Tax=Galbitalea sp. SE-J8 TaxID=3054952 RepID=UPI00259CC848|nr:hypothetical protein [Galbitalea sp. SE-J8]MDM4762402.1 hypothetical protein [Galbitalea sp. SE-J8]
MTRILVVAWGLGTFVFAALIAGEIVAQARTLAPWLTGGAVTVFVVAPAVLAALAYAVPVRALRVAILADAAVALAVAALWWFALDPAELPARPWLFDMCAVAGCGVALVLPYAATACYTVAMAAVVALLDNAVTGGREPLTAILDLLFTLLFAVVFVTMLSLALYSARRQDAVRATAEADAVRATTAEAVDRQRERYQEFVRTELLDVYASVRADGATPSAATRLGALQVLTRIDELRSGQVRPAFVDAEEFEAMLGAASGGAVPVGLTVFEPPGQRVLMPVEVADVLAEAYGEAVRNSLAHAARRPGALVLRRSRVVLAPESVDIVVSDDGRGFSPAGIAPDRVGVRIGILHTVNSTPGCAARVTSGRGRGTVVTLEWRRDRSRA